jgi:predicted DNA-binding antitoxin AbrB/MazE fold protein
MSQDIEAIYTHGVFRPLDPLVLSDGARVQLHVVELNPAEVARFSPARVLSPRLVHPEQAIDFEMEVREVPDAGV